MISGRTIAEISGVLGVVYLLDRLYAVTGHAWFSGLNFWVAPLPFIVALIPFLVLIVGPASKKTYDIASKKIASRKYASKSLLTQADVHVAFSERGE